MSSYPPEQPQPEQGMMFQQPQQPDPASAGRQLLTEVAPISQAIQALATAHPDMSEGADQMLQILKAMVIQSISQMQGSQEGGTPAY
jgi:hypothetical protein